MLYRQLFGFESDEYPVKTAESLREDGELIVSRFRVRDRARWANDLSLEKMAETFCVKVETFINKDR
jgi:hypothetical protein